jgi:Glycosyltransferase sugar-binding region containing DXD motif
MMLVANDFMDNVCRKRSVAGKALVLFFLSGNLIVLFFTSIDLVLPFGRAIDTDSNTNDRMTSLSSSAAAPDSSSMDHLTHKTSRQPTTFSIELSKYHDLRAPMFSETIPLNELVNTGPDPECNSTDSYTMLLFPSIQPPQMHNDSINPHQKIPKIIHMTATSRCMTDKIRANIKKWEALPDYTIYFHDDMAVDRLLSKYWPHFPHLAMAQRCSISGAAKADIWRYLVLWEYGGLYTGT